MLGGELAISLMEPIRVIGVSAMEQAWARVPIRHSIAPRGLVNPIQFYTQ